jgi:hypothetical protein
MNCPKCEVDIFAHGEICNDGEDGKRTCSGQIGGSMNELREALENVLEIGCWQAVPGTEDWKCRWCQMVKNDDPTANAPHHEDCAYMVARAALAAPAVAETGDSQLETKINAIKWKIHDYLGSDSMSDCWSEVGPMVRALAAQAPKPISPLEANRRWFDELLGAVEKFGPEGVRVANKVIRPWLGEQICGVCGRRRDSHDTELNGHDFRGRIGEAQAPKPSTPQTISAYELGFKDGMDAKSAAPASLSTGRLEELAEKLQDAVYHYGETTTGGVHRCDYGLDRTLAKQVLEAALKDLPAAPSRCDLYASYANHCAIRKKVPVTWHTWKRQQATVKQPTPASNEYDPIPCPHNHPARNMTCGPECQPAPAKEKQS